MKNRARRRRAAKKLMKYILKNQLSSEKVNMSRRERRKKAWNQAISIMREWDNVYKGRD